MRLHLPYVCYYPTHAVLYAQASCIFLVDIPADCAIMGT